MAAQGEPGYLAAQSDPGSNSERSTDSPVPGSEDDLVAGAPLHSPEWSEERFRVDRKKLEAMLQVGYLFTPKFKLRSPLARMKGEEESCWPAKTE
nr:PREDICTED: protein bicaudal C homolog 1-like [Equus przewalskii]